jgi:hypothetical protein
MMDELLSARPGTHSRAASFEEGGVDRGINFTMFLTMMSERLFEFDTEAELIEAFESFDEADKGTVKVDEMRKWLSEVGERMDMAEVRRDSSVVNCTDSYPDRQAVQRPVYRPTGQLQLPRVGQGAQDQRRGGDEAGDDAVIVAVMNSLGGLGAKAE